jgi:hypothetical protein
MKTVILLGLCFYFLFLFPVSGMCEDGAKALFFGSTLQDSVSVSKTPTGAAAFSGTQVTTETISPSEARTEKPPTSASTKPTNKRVTSTNKRLKTVGKIATGLSYWIEVLNPNGRIERCTAASRVFNAGDRFRLAFRTNKDGYLYLLLIGSSGTGSKLFPNARINDGNNFVRKNIDYLIPFGDKGFVMDATPGQERVLVFFSQSEMPNLDSQLEKGNALQANETRAVYAYAQTNTDTEGSKDFALEDDNTGAKPASYVITKSTNPKTVIFREIMLKHR